MFLAATSDTMVSPSEIVDIVWHQHLIFTKSYNDFAAILGKRIDHIPSTHHDGEKEKFGQARKQTLAKYETEFGTPPNDIWLQHSFYVPLIKNKSTWSTNTLILVGLVVACLFYFPLYTALKPTIIQINNPSFIYGFIALLVITLVIFFGLTSAILSALAKKLYAQNFLKDLHPLEVIYMKKGSLVPIVHGITNQLIKTSQLEQTTVDNKLKRTKKQVTHANPFEYCVYNAIKEKKTMEYAPIVRSLVKKPLFLQLSNFTETINEQVVKTKSYLFLHILHFGVFSFFFLIGFIRLQTGVSRERPVLFLLILLMATITLYFLSLWQLDVFFTKRSIPQLYDEKFHTIKGSDAASVSASNWGWRYFIYDELVLEKAFLPVIYYFDRRNMKDSASSCGSGCGSSCGGGGGCGGGCGGCGG